MLMILSFGRFAVGVLFLIPSILTHRFVSFSNFIHSSFFKSRTVALRGQKH